MSGEAAAVTVGGWAAEGQQGGVGHPGRHGLRRADRPDTSTVIGPAPSDHQRGSGTGPSAQTWTITAYSLAFGAALVAGGRMGDLVGEVKMIVAGFAVRRRSVDVGDRDRWALDDQRPCHPGHRHRHLQAGDAVDRGELFPIAQRGFAAVGYGDSRTASASCWAHCSPPG